MTTCQSDQQSHSPILSFFVCLVRIDQINHTQDYSATHENVFNHYLQGFFQSISQWFASIEKQATEMVFHKTDVKNNLRKKPPEH